MIAICAVRANLCGRTTSICLLQIRTEILIWTSYSSAQRFQMQMEDWLYGSDRSQMCRCFHTGNDYTLLRQTDERLDSEYLVLLGSLKDGGYVYMRDGMWRAFVKVRSITNQFFVMVSTGAIFLSMILIVVLSNRNFAIRSMLLSDIARRMTRTGF